jgi:hypothetical protein
MSVRRQNPVLPAIIVALFLSMLVFLFVSRKGQAGASSPQSTHSR